MQMKKAEAQGRFAKFLLNAENQRSKQEFFRFLGVHKSIDPTAIQFSVDSVNGEEYAIITGEHALERMFERVGLQHEELTELLDSHMRSSEVAAGILSHQVILDDDDNIVAFDKGAISTIVVTEGSHVLVVYEAGLAYIRVKTLWDTRDGAFFNPAHVSAVIKLMADGTVISNPTPEQIPEVKLTYR